MNPLFLERLKDKITNIGDSWDKLAPLEIDAIDFGHRYVNPEPPKKLTAFTYSLEYCLAHSGETINNRYRHDRPEDIDKKIEQMVASHKTKKDMVVYRGVCKVVFDLMKSNAKNFDGVDLYEKSFLQTSLVKGCESNSEYHLRIYIPAGTEAVYLGNVNDEQFYYEVDIQHGVKLKIISVDDKYINCKIVQ